MKLEELSIIDKEELLDEIENMDFLYRDKLNFSSEIKFGIEIEYGNAKKSDVMKVMNGIKGEETSSYYKSWGYSFDSAFACNNNSEYYGGELVSPILKNKKEYFKQISLACHTLKDNSAVLNEKMGFHVHVSRDALKSTLISLENFLKIYMLYEDIIYKFAFYGKAPRFVINTYANSVSYMIYDTLINNNYSSYEELYSLLDFFIKDKSISISEGAPTFEFRICNATINPIIIQNNINLFCSLIEASKDNNIDLDKINYDLEKFMKSSYTKKIPKKDMNRAITFSDIIFKDDIDKKYFLKQYLM